MLWKSLTTTITATCFFAYTVFLPTMALADPPTNAPDTPEKDRALGMLRSNLQLKIDLCAASRDAQKFRFDETLKIRNGQISFLESQLKPSPWYESGEFWFAVGLVGGVLITIGAGYAIGQANK